MRRKNRPCLSLEQMEDRQVPATVSFYSGQLFVSNPSLQTGQPSLTLTQLSMNRFQVKDGTATLGTYNNVSSLSITGSNGADSITVNLGAFEYTGSLSVNGKSGNDTVNIHGSGGAVRGNVTVLHGTGDASIGLNSNGTGALTIRGTTTINNQLGDDSVSLGDVVLTGTGPTVGAGPSSFRGNVNITGVPTVLMGSGDQPDSYGGDVNVSSVNSNIPLFFVQGQHISMLGSLGIPVQVAGSLRITAGSGSDAAGNFGNQILTGDLVVGKDLVINAGHTSATGIGNAVGLGQSAVGFTTVNGNLQITNGSGPIFVDLAGSTVQGNTNLTLGNGAISVVALDRSTSGQPTVFNGNLSISANTGDLNLNPFGTGIQSSIGGNFQVTVGNGNLTMPIDTAYTTVGGKVIVRAGHGNNNVSFSNSAASLAAIYNLDFLFGNGDNVLTLNDAMTSLTGRVVGGTGSNVFNHLAGNIVQPWYLENFNG